MPQYQVGYCFGLGSFGVGSWRQHSGPYGDGAAAARELKLLQATHTVADGYRWSIKKFRDDGLPEDWKEREAARFANGSYEPVPWANQSWAEKAAEHFAHLSLNDPGKIAYTEDAAKGECDRQTRIAPGRYLKKHFGDVLTAAEIEEYASEVSILTNACSLKITSDADEIERVYVNGPNSCMSGDEDDFSGHCHPTRVYAGPDLALAYTGDTDDASGRVVVWPEKKRYSTIYGDGARLRMLLKDAGYEPGPMTGARIRRIPDSNGNGFVMPYIDGHYSVGESDCRQFFIIGDHGYDCSNTGGTTWNANAATCERCGDRYDPESEGYYLESIEENWCDSCGMDHTVHCEVTGVTYPDSEATVEVHGSTRLYAFQWHGACFNCPAFEYTDHTRTAVLSAIEDHEEVIYLEDREEYWQRSVVELIEVIREFAAAFSNPQAALDLAA